jgi:hypothetical protein
VLAISTDPKLSEWLHNKTATMVRTVQKEAFASLERRKKKKKKKKEKKTNTKQNKTNCKCCYDVPCGSHFLATR